MTHPDRNGALAILGGGEGLALLGWDRGVTVDKTREHAAKGLDAQRQRGDVEEKNVLYIALQHAGLNGGAHGHDLVRIDAPVRFLAEHLFHDLLDLGHAGHAADQNHLVDFGGLEAGILKCLFARAPGARDEIIHQALQFGARELHSEMLRAGLVRRDKRQIDFGLLRRRQLNFRLLRGLFQALECELVVAQIDTLFFLELIGKVVDELHIEVFAA